MMKILCYSALRDADEERFLEKTKPARIEIRRSFGKLKERLNIPSPTSRVVIFIIRWEEEISGLAEWIDSYVDLLIILVLHSQTPEILKGAYKMRPRYICGADNDFQDIADVLKRMEERHGPG